MANQKEKMRERDACKATKKPQKKPFKIRVNLFGKYNCESDGDKL